MAAANAASIHGDAADFFTKRQMALSEEPAPALGDFSDFANLSESAKAEANHAVALPGDAMPRATSAATVSVQLTGDVGRADLGETLVDIATELARALANDDIDELLAAVLAEFGERRGSGTLRHAAHVLRGRKGGRPPLNVEEYVDEAVDLHKSGLVKTLNKGFLKVARTMPGTAALRSKASLLRKRHHDRKISAAKQV
jgi:hypothetical protein